MNFSIQSVSKQYRRDFWGLRGFSLELTPGVLGLLGPNGAGKLRVSLPPSCVMVVSLC